MPKVKTGEMALVLAYEISYNLFITAIIEQKRFLLNLNMVNGRQSIDNGNQLSLTKICCLDFGKSDWG